MFQVRVLTPAYLLTGEVEETNMFLGWLNNKDKNALDLHHVEGLVLDPEAIIPTIQASLVTLDKSQVVGIELVSPNAQRSVKISDRIDQAILYTPRFVIRGYLHPTGEMPINRIPDVIKSNFVPATHVNLHPLIPTRKLPTRDAAVMIFNWRHIDFYHAAV